MKILFIAALLLCLYASMSFARDIELTGRFIPKDGQTYIFGGQNNADSDDFVKITDRTPFGFMIYTSLSDLGG
ncbi:MAG: hypothetical protein LBU09_00420, partial [Endomicrobium sp.]|nr:hypothetical protein [Endomicrobium sp.]